MSKNNQIFIKHKLKFLWFLRKKSTFSYALKWLIISTLIGLMVGSASAIFLITLDWATQFRENNFWIILLLPIGGFFIGWLYHKYGQNVEKGNHLLLESIENPSIRIPFRMAPLVYIGTMATHFFGGSAGREGTALQMAGAISYQITKPFKLGSDDRKILLIAAISAGFASVFGTPLAGAIFGLEVLLAGKFRYRAIFPAFASAIIADFVTHLWPAHHTTYVIPFVPKLEVTFIFYAILTGIIFGLCAILFTKGMHKGSQVFKTQIKFPPLRPFIGGIIVVALVFLLDTTKYIGLGIPTIVESFQIQEPFQIFVLKMIFTIITLSAGFKGGEVTPLFFIGATLGSALSLFFPLPVALLAGMGFVAVFAGATNTPLACTIMGIELFGLESVVYLALAVVVSYLFSGHHSIYGNPKIVAKNRRLISRF